VTVVVQLAEPTHPIVACVEQLNALLADVAVYDPTYLCADDQRTVLLGLAEVERRLAGFKLRIMAAAKAMADTDGARDVAAWLAPRTHAALPPLRAEQRLADALDKRWTRVADGMRDGVVSVEQAHVIVHALEALPAHVGIETIARAEARLVDLMVTISLESLMKDLGAGTIVGGEPMTASQVRRLACEAGILPVVLGGNSEILDLGRTRRLFSPAQRKAMALRDGRCRAEGCTVPARWSEAHHDRPWSQGGRTDLEDGRLYCSWHHHRAHDPHFTAEMLTGGDVRFTRRT